MVRRLLVRLAVLALVTTAVTVMAQGPAAACSCATGTPHQMVAGSDVGFIGSLAAVERHGVDATYSFDVELWLNGDLQSATVEADAPADGAACGFELAIGRRAAVFLERRGDRLTGGLCSTLEADVTLAALDSTPTPGGTAAFAVPGVYSAGLFAMLDADGQLVGYLGEPSEYDVPQFYACPGGTRVVAVGFPMIQVIDLTTMEAVRSVDTGDLQQSGVIEDADCADAAADDVLLLVDDAAGAGLEVRPLDRWDQPGLAFDREPGARAIIVGEMLVATEPQDPGELLVALDPDGTRRVLGEVERPADSNFAGYESIIADPTGTMVAASEVTSTSSSVVGRIFVVDPLRGEEIASADTDGGVVIVGWLDDGRLVTMSTAVDSADLQLRDSATLEVVARVDGWDAYGAALIGDEVWGVWAGDVLRGSTSTKVAESVSVLPSSITGQILALASPVEVAPGRVVAPVAAPRQPLAITDDEAAARVAIESAADTGSRSPLAIAAVVGIALVIGVTVVVRRRPA